MERSKLTKELSLKKVAVILIISHLLLAIILIYSLFSFTNKISDISKDETVNYELIEEVIRTSVEEHFNEQIEINIDYDRIEFIVEEKLKEFNKDFGENFEDATYYFGGKIKETYGDIRDRLKNN